MPAASVPAPQPPSQALQVKYEDTMARYANHVMLNVSNEECYLDFSSGVVSDKATGVPVMPVHTRIVMTPAGARRLHQLLGHALQEQQNKRAEAAQAPVNRG